MKDEQKQIVAWMRRVLALREWSAEEWARRAEVSPTTITRGMQASYNGVTGIPVLHKLARAAGVASPLDGLRHDRVVVEIPSSPEELASLGYADADDAIRDAVARRIRAILDAQER